MHSKMDETDEEDDDDVIYGDNWSSSDDEQTIEDGQLSNGSNTSAERGFLLPQSLYNKFINAFISIEHYLKPSFPVKKPNAFSKKR